MALISFSVFISRLSSFFFWSLGAKDLRIFASYPYMKVKQPYTLDKQSSWFIVMVFVHFVSLISHWLPLWSEQTFCSHLHKNSVIEYTIVLYLCNVAILLLVCFFLWSRLITKYLLWLTLRQAVHNGTCFHTFPPEFVTI